MAARFDASTDWYSRTTGLGSVTAFSASCWVMLSVDRNTWSTLWSATASNSATGLILQTNSDGNALLVWDLGVNDAITTTQPSLTVGTWCWVGFQVNGANGAMYVRAVTDTSVTTSSFTNSATPRSVDTLRIGESIAGGEWLNGCLAAMKFWSGAALTAAELINESFTYTPARTQDLALWYPLVNAELVDYSGNAGTLTAGSSATTTEAGPPIPWSGQRPRILAGATQAAPPGPTEITGTFLEDTTSQTSRTITVPAWVTAGMTALIAIGTGSSTVVTFTLTKSGATFTLLDEQNAVNTRCSVWTGTGLTAGDTITITSSAGCTVSVQHIYTANWTFGALSAAIRGGSQATTTTGSLTPAAGQQVVAVGIERTTATPTVITAVSSSGGETVDLIAYNEGPTVQTSVGLWKFTASAASARTVTVTYDDASGNGYGALILTYPTQRQFRSNDQARTRAALI